MTGLALYDVTDGIATITLNRPESLNSLNEELSLATQEALAQAAGDPAVRCVVLTGAGRGFCSGADLAGLDVEPGEPIPVGNILRRRYHPIVTAIVSMEKPVIASVNGIAAGAGASLACACDFRIAADTARFFQAFVKIGLVPDSGGTYFLPRLVGMAKALELAMLGDIIDAAEAARIGLVTKVVPAAQLAAETRAFAERLATGPTRAYGLTKRALHFGAVADLHSALELEAEVQEHAVRTHDSVEGVTAFLQKRPPDFQGR